MNAGKEEPGDEKAASRLRNAEDRLASLESFLPRSGVCDVGCGDGSFLSALRDEGYGECWGIEPSLYACGLASDKQLDVVQGGLSELTEAREGRTLNALTLFHVIEHLPDPLGALRTLKNALEPRGILVMETPDANAAIQRVTDHKNGLVYHQHLFYWTEKSLRRVLEQEGFRMLSIARRSFDWKNAPIQSSLMRLGILNKRFSVDPQADACLGTKSASPGKQSYPGGNFLRQWARVFLAYVVHALKRDDYLLVVAERV